MGVTHLVVPRYGQNNWQGGATKIASKRAPRGPPRVVLGAHWGISRGCPGAHLANYFVDSMPVIAQASCQIEWKLSGLASITVVA